MAAPPTNDDLRALLRQISDLAMSCYPFAEGTHDIDPHLVLTLGTIAGRAQAALAGDGGPNPALLGLRDDLVSVVAAQHEAIDWLLARLLTRDDTFRPSQSPVWPAVEKGWRALRRAREAH